jgi:hypothetical protein
MPSSTLPPIPSRCGFHRSSFSSTSDFAFTFGRTFLPTGFFTL